MATRQTQTALKQIARLPAEWMKQTGRSSESGDRMKQDAGRMPTRVKTQGQTKHKAKRCDNVTTHGQTEIGGVEWCSNVLVACAGPVCTAAALGH